MDIEFNKEITRRILDLNEKILEINLKLFDYLNTPRIEVRSNIQKRDLDFWKDNYLTKVASKDE